MSRATELERLRTAPLEELLEEAWRLRQEHLEDALAVSAPSHKRYRTDEFCNSCDSFVDVSVTGGECALDCDHCGGVLLESMEHVSNPEEMRRLGRELAEEGADGVLVSGGADESGRVPLTRFLPAMEEMKDLGLDVIAHTGLVTERDAEGLAEAGVDQVLLDVIGDRSTIREVYHLDREPRDYRDSLQRLKDAGLTTAPHVVAGLHGGEVRGEYEALRVVTEAESDVVVIVALSPLPGTRFSDAEPPGPEEIARLVAAARILNPEKRVALGCARPAATKGELDRLAVDAGVSTISYPSDSGLDRARERGLSIDFSELCCTLV